MMRLCASNLLVTFALECLEVSVLQGAVFYVDPEKRDMDNDGSAELPWKTVEQVFERNLIQTRDTAGRLRATAVITRSFDVI